MFVVYLLCENSDLPEKIKEMPHGMFFKTVASPSELPQGKRGVVIVHNLPQGAVGLIPAGYVGVAQEGDAVAMRLFKESGIQAVTCGFSPTATVTLTSVGDDCAAVGIQRSMLSLNGAPVEEGEFSVKFREGYDQFVAMAWATAALLALGPNKFPAFV